MNSTILRDRALDSRFKRDGYLKLPIIDRASLEALRNLYALTRQAHEAVATSNPFHSTQDTFNGDLIAYVDQEAKRVLMPLVMEHFHNYKVLTANFLVKEPGPDSVLHPHQDWSFVDETEFFSFNIWIPLEPTERANGCLRFLPGSHRIVPTIRANDKYTWAFQGVIDSVEQHLLDVPTDEGDCVLLNHSVIHGSWPNLGSQPRVALVLGMCPANASLRHYVSNNGKTVRVFGILPEHIVNLRRGEPPIGAELLETYDYDFPQVDEAGFRAWLNGKEERL